MGKFALLPLDSLLQEEICKILDEAQHEVQEEAEAEMILLNLIEEFAPTETYEVVSEEIINGLKVFDDIPRFEHGYWRHVRVHPHHCPEIGEGDERTVFNYKQIYTKFPDKYDSPATLQYLGFRASAIPRFWYRYLSIIKGGYKPYTLWDFVFQCILDHHPMDGGPLAPLEVWEKIADELGLNDRTKISLSQRLFHQARRDTQVYATCLQCTAWIMEGRWERLRNMEKHVGAEYILEE